MNADRKFVALSVHPWSDLEIARLEAADGKVIQVPPRALAGPGFGFLIAYATREEAEAAEPGAEIIEMAPCGAGGGH